MCDKVVCDKESARARKEKEEEEEQEKEADGITRTPHKVLGKN